MRYPHWVCLRAIVGGVVIMASCGRASSLSTPSGWAPSVKIGRSIQSYDLHAESIQVLRDEHRELVLKKIAPPYFGETRWDFTFAPDVRQGVRTSCSQDPISLSVDVKTILPNAVALARFSPEDRTRWQSFQNGLHRHESRHDSIAVSVSKAFMREVADNRGDRALGTIENCVSALRAQLTRASNELDRQTNHGQTDGAVLYIERKD